MSVDKHQPPLPGTDGDDPVDQPLESVYDHLMKEDPGGSHMEAALRRSLDMLLDGPRTGRYSWEQLHKTEKTHCGTLVEINFQREFGFDGGKKLDYCIVGVEVDCKYSQDFGKWMIPPEAVDQVLLVVWASDQKGIWSAGLVRARKEWLNGGDNRDQKINLKARERRQIRWLFQNAPLTENALLRLSAEDLEAIFSKKSGQQRINELFRRAERRRLSRNAIWTVATANGKPKDDPTRRIRDGEQGARGQLRPEGIVIFGDYAKHREAAAVLELPVPGEGEYVSARLARRRPHHAGKPFLTLDGEEWVLAGPDDPVEVAPRLPNIKKGPKTD